MEKESLTNEKLLKKFKSQFELVNYAIRLAENMIKTGRDARVRTEAQNKALQVVVEIEQDKDKFDEIPVRESAKEEVNGAPSQEAPLKRFSEPKKKIRERELRK